MELEKTDVEGFNGFKLEKLNSLYEDAKTNDKVLFSEQRTNILLRNGDHYNKKDDSAISNIRNNGYVKSESDTKIRLTKNKIHKVTNVYINQIMDTNPSVEAAPFNSNELNDKKAAELSNSVLSWIKAVNDWKSFQPRFIEDYVVVGEVFSKVRFDYSRGPKAVDTSGNIVHAGEIVIDKHFGFDTKVDPSARCWSEVKWVCFDVIMDKADVIDLLVSLDKGEMARKLEAEKGEVYKIYDQNSGRYIKKTDKMVVREWFWRPDARRPDGWYALTTDVMDIEQKPLPAGIFPVEHAGFDLITATPRASSIIRVARPYQVEINRASSKMAEHQITIGDDRVLINSATKLAAGGKMYGVQALKFTGPQPTIVEGRSGAHYLPYVQNEIGEMYDSTDVAGAMQDKVETNDPWLALMRAAKDKKKFGKYVNAYQLFEVRLFKKALDMARYYLNEAHIINIVGSSEQMNIEEFKNSTTGFEVKIVESDGSLEDKFGRVLTLTNVLQYVGGQLSPDQIAAIIKNLPYGNSDEIFNPLTINYDNAVNDILALDRGEYRPALPTDNHDYMAQALSNRMKKSDYRYLPPNIQQMYQMKIAEHNQMSVAQKEAIARQSAGSIPAGGVMVNVIASTINPQTGKPDRIKLPSDAVLWLVKKLEEQGYYTQLTAMQNGFVAEQQSQMASQMPQDINGP